jgi:DNA invertase Pin-like site-specific DNA recombinase
MKKVGIYIRVSTQDQKVDGISVEIQKDKGIKFCERNDWDYEIYDGDVGESRYKGRDERKDLNRLYNNIEDGIIDVLWVYNLDRFMSNLSEFFEWEEMIKKVSLERGFKLYEDNDEVDFMNSNKMLSVHIHQLMSGYIQKSYKVRGIESMERLWKEGKFIYGRPPIGLKVVKKNLIVDEDRVKVILSLFELVVDRGIVNYSEINRVLKNRGMVLSVSTIGNIVEQKKLNEWLYKGYYIREVNGFENKFELGFQVLSKSRYDEFYKRMNPEGKQRLNYRELGDYSKYSIGYGLYNCGSCGKKIYIMKKSNGLFLYCKTKYNKNISIESLIKEKGIVGCESGGMWKLEDVDSYLWYSIKRSMEKSEFYGKYIDDNKVGRDEEIERLLVLDKTIKKRRENVIDLNKRINGLKGLYEDDDLELDVYIRDRRFYMESLEIERDKLRRCEEEKEDLENEFGKDRNKKLLDELRSESVDRLLDISDRRKFILKWVGGVSLFWEDRENIMLRIKFSQPIIDYKVLKVGNYVIKDQVGDENRLLRKYHSFKKK